MRPGKNQLVNEGAVPLPSQAKKHWMEVDDEKTASPVPSPDGKWIHLLKSEYLCKGGGYRKEESNRAWTGHWVIIIQPTSAGHGQCKKVVSARSVRWKSAVYYVESSPADQLQPKLQNRNAEAGETNFL